jgi:excisionase family DNA binding protein
MVLVGTEAHGMSPHETMGGQRIAVGVKEAGVLVGVSPRLIRKAIHEGRLASTRFGRRRLVLIDDLRRLLEFERRLTPPG